MMAGRAPAEYPARTDRLRPNAADVEFLAHRPTAGVDGLGHHEFVLAQLKVTA